MSQFCFSVLDCSLYHICVTLNCIYFFYDTSVIFGPWPPRGRRLETSGFLQGEGFSPKPNSHSIPLCPTWLAFQQLRGFPPKLTHIIATDRENMQTFGLIWSHIYIQMSVGSDTKYDANYINRNLNIPIRKCPSTKFLGLDVWDLSNGRNNVKFYFVYSE